MSEAEKVRLVRDTFGLPLMEAKGMYFRQQRLLELDKLCKEGSIEEKVNYLMESERLRVMNSWKGIAGPVLLQDIEAFINDLLKE